MLPGQVVTTVDVFEALFQCSFLLNEFSDDKSDCSILEFGCIFEFEVGERDC